VVVVRMEIYRRKNGINNVDSIMCLNKVILSWIGPNSCLCVMRVTIGFVVFYVRTYLIGSLYL
jgi:hypothetical protein